jgi:hypothetical protein
MSSLPAQVLLDRARADEQPGGDLGVREAVADEAGKLDLPSGQVADGADTLWAVRNWSRASPTRTAQPFAVEQMGAGELPRTRVRVRRSMASR